MKLKKPFFYLASKKASLLILTIWIMVFFSILSLALFKAASAQATVLKRIEARIFARYLVKSAVVMAQGLRTQDKDSFDSLYKLSLVVERQLGLGKFKYSMIDEESKININTATEEILKKIPGFDNDIAKKIISSSLKPFAVKEEVLLIQGMDEEKFKQCKDLITVHSTGGININTASTQVLEILGMDSGLSGLIKNYRSSLNSEKGDGSNRCFEEVNQIVTALGSYGALSAAQLQVLGMLIGQGALCVKSSVFTLNVETELKNNPAGRYHVIIDANRIYQWKEG